MVLSILKEMIYVNHFGLYSLGQLNIYTFLKKLIPMLYDILYSIKFTCILVNENYSHEFCSSTSHVHTYLQYAK